MLPSGWPPPPPPLVTTNLARNKPVAASSQLDNTLGPEKAVDGIIPPLGSLNSTFISAGLGEMTPWLVIDLKELVTVDRFVFYNRRDCCGEEVSGATVFFGGAGITQSINGQYGNNPQVYYAGDFEQSSTGEVVSFIFDSPPTGRFFIFQNSFKPEWIPGILSIAELEVYGEPAGTSACT